VLPATNPFVAASDLPFGLPPFGRIVEEHYRPAFEAGMAEQRAEIETVVTDPAEPSFANTVEALERSGRLLDRAASVFFNLTSADTTQGLQALEAELAPELSAHHDAIYLDARLYERFSAVYARRDELALTAEQARLLERYQTDFVRAGAALSAADQESLRALNGELSLLQTRFQSRLLADTNDLAVHVDDVGQLAGLAPDAVDAARQAAAGRGLDGYLLTLVLPTGQPALASLRDRDVRERLHTAAVTRGLRGNENDTREVLTRIVALRAQRAVLLGYRDHASFVIADQTAKTLDAVDDMLGALVPAAVANAAAEAVELEQALVADGGHAPLRPWDWAYYAEQVRRQRFDVDAAALRPYFELQRVVHAGVLDTATRLYGLTFERRHDLVGYHRDVEVFEVADADGSPVGLFLADWFTRDSKRGGAWMSTFVDQSHLLGQRPVAVLNLNITPPSAGGPALLTMDEVRTLFHEFGHVLHGLMSDVRYPRFSGTSVPRDFVEFPSQVNEMWAWSPEVLARYAVHHETGEPLPLGVLGRLLESRSYGEGFGTTEYLGAALLDLEWHRLTPEQAVVEPGGVEDFEAAALDGRGIAVAAVPPRYRTSYFAHVFAGGYSAGYYSYIWSEVLDADTVDWFTENGGLRRGNGDVFRSRLLSVGGSVDPMEAFAAVRGRPPRIEPLLERRGLLSAATAGGPA
jgi:peptidyl-dipeptidase Dcp